MKVEVVDNVGSDESDWDNVVSEKVVPAILANLSREKIPNKGVETKVKVEMEDGELLEDYVEEVIVKIDKDKTAEDAIPENLVEPQLEANLNLSMDDLSSVSSDEDEETQVICKKHNCHCHKINQNLVKENQAMKVAIADLNNRNQETEDFFQVEFGERYNLFRKHRSHLIQIGFGETADPEMITGSKNENTSEAVKLLGMIKEQEDEQHSTELSASPQALMSCDPSTSKRPRLSPAQSPTQPSYMDNLELSLQNRLSSIPSRSELHGVPAQLPTFTSIRSSFNQSIPDPLGDSKHRACVFCHSVLHATKLREHLLIHKGSRVLCPKCKVGFWSKGYLKTHWKLHHRSLCGSPSYIKVLRSLQDELNWLKEMKRASKTLTNVQYQIYCIQSAPSTNDA